MSGIFRSLVFVFIAVAAQAQMPHELLLLVNTNSQPSLLAANTFASLRKVPKQNMVYLGIPESAYGGTATITPDEFTRLIWEPANAAARERGIDGQILAWVYSVDFPIRVKTDSSDRRQMSVGGMTFLRNQSIGLGLVEDGKYFSRLFAGPNQRLQVKLPSVSLGRHRDGLGPDAKLPEDLASLRDGLGAKMPLPSMMLGYIGENGNDMQTVLDCLVRGQQADYHGKNRGIYFITGEDVRSTCREWQYAQTAVEIDKLGVKTVTTTNFPAGAENVMGLLMGAETVDPSSIGSFAPGAMAEHLTSWSAEFQKPQTKTTKWIEAGATASAGAVVEPYSNHNKFPSARFYVHYISGCTMLESFYQSIACPLQSLLLGDPLARPYAIPLSVKLLGSTHVDEDFTYVAKATCRYEKAEILYSYLLDGKEIKAPSSDPSLYLRINGLSDGYHDLRVVARIKHRVEHSALDEKGIMINRLGRSVSIDPDIRKIAKYKHGIKAVIKGDELPEKIRLVCGELVLDEKPYSAEAELELNERAVGEGPNRLRVIAAYADGMDVSSSPLTVGIKFVE